MANELSKAIKQKTDSQLRLLDQDTAPVIRQTTTGDNYAVDPNEYSQSLAAGTNITINTAGNIKTINAVFEQATETELGAVKAKVKTSETAEVAIDTATGKLFSQMPEGAAVVNQNNTENLLFWVGTEAEFNLIVTPDPNTLYFRGV